MSSVLKKHRSYILICVSCLFLTVMALLIAVKNPTIGYEISIYQSTPVTVWVLIIFSMVICLVLLLMEIRQSAVSRRWLLPLGILMTNSLVILMMSVIRGYFAVGGDILMHIGYVKDLANGIISTRDVYPVVHAISAVLVIAGLSPSLATSLSPIFWYLVYVISFYFLARFLWAEKRMVILATTLSAVVFLPHGVGLVATLVGASMFPLTLLVMLKLQRDFKIRHLIFYLIVFVISAITHPVAFEVAMVALVVACIVFAKNRWKLVTVAVLLLSTTMWWYGYWYNMHVEQLVMQGINNMLPTTVTQLEILPESVVEIEHGLSLLPPTIGIERTQTIGTSSAVILVIKRYGNEIILGGIAILCLVAIAWKRMKGVSFRQIDVYCGCLFLLLNLMWITGWYLQLGKFSASLTRLLYWIPILSIILLVPFLARVLKMHKVIMAIVVFVLLLMSSVAVFTRYHSPFIGVGNLQITHQEMAGMKWLIDNGEPSVYVVFLNDQRVNRYVGAIYGVDYAYQNQRYYWLAEYEPVHGVFSYNDYQTLGEKYEEDVYLVVTKLDRVLPRWGKDKLYLLESDPTATCLYRDDDEFGVWYVEGFGDD